MINNLLDISVCSIPEYLLVCILTYPTGSSKYNNLLHYLVIIHTKKSNKINFFFLREHGNKSYNLIGS